MDWFNFCKTNFDLGNAKVDNLKIYVVKNKITAEQYKEITGVDYILQDNMANINIFIKEVIKC